jgi:hypothetical protein
MSRAFLAIIAAAFDAANGHEKRSVSLHHEKQIQPQQ